VSVACAGGVPVTVAVWGRRRRVVTVVDEWLVEDGWWRTPVARRYLQLVLDDGRLLTVFEDRLAGAWYAQPYPASVREAGSPEESREWAAGSGGGALTRIVERLHGHGGDAGQSRRIDERGLPRSAPRLPGDADSGPWTLDSRLVPA
jgi:hypothetical protein